MICLMFDCTVQLTVEAYTQGTRKGRTYLLGKFTRQSRFCFVYHGIKWRDVAKQYANSVS